MAFCFNCLHVFVVLLCLQFLKMKISFFAVVAARLVLPRVEIRKNVFLRRRPRIPGGAVLFSCSGECNWISEHVGVDD